MRPHLVPAAVNGISTAPACRRLHIIFYQQKGKRLKNRITKILAVIGILVIVFCTAAGSANNTVSTAAVKSGIAYSETSLKLTSPARSLLTAHAKGAPRPDWLPGAFSAGKAAAPPASSQVEAETAAAARKPESFSKLLTELYDPAYAYSDEEKAYVARVVYAEARGEIFDGKVAVAAVVLNRFESGRFGKTVKKVVFARNQFAVSKKYSAECMAAVEAAIEQSDAYPDDMYYFRVSKSKKWRNFDYYTRIGNHSFYCA